MGTQHRSRTFFQCGWDEIMSVPRALKRKKQLTFFQFSGVVIGSEKCNVCIFRINLPAAPLGGLG
jgi:hypothetical protein